MIPRRVLFLLPALAFIVLVGFFVVRLALIERGNTPDKLPSVLLNQAAPDFVLPNLDKDRPDVSLKAFRGSVVLVNVFASWCSTCYAEHPFVSYLQKSNLVLIGLDYKDRPEAANAWLVKHGNPYNEVAQDRDGRVAIDFGVYGVPESYLIDKQGIVRYKQTGAITPKDLVKTILPLVEELNK